MTCKDCFHCGVCFKNDDPDEQIEVCIDFIDKSKTKEFPCNVGDTVYTILEDCDTPPLIDIGKVFALGVDENLIHWISVRYESGLKMYYTPDNLGKSCYLTPEKAEKALKERENK